MYIKNVVKQQLRTSRLFGHFFKYKTDGYGEGCIWCKLLRKKPPGMCVACGGTQTKYHECNSY